MFLRYVVEFVVEVGLIKVVNCAVPCGLVFSPTAIFPVTTNHVYIDNDGSKITLSRAQRGHFDAPLC